MTSLTQLPAELILHCLTFLDIKTLAKVGGINKTLRAFSDDTTLWETMVYEPKHRNQCHRKGQNVLLEAFWEALKIEYRPLHPLYAHSQKVIQVLKRESVKETGPLTARSILGLASTAQHSKDNVDYTKAIILHETAHTTLLAHARSAWLLHLEKTLQKEPALFDLLVDSQALQKLILSQPNEIGDDFVDFMQYASAESILMFMQSPKLERLREVILSKVATHCADNSDFHPYKDIETINGDQYLVSVRASRLLGYITKALDSHPAQLFKILEILQPWILSGYGHKNLKIRALLQLSSDNLQRLQQHPQLQKLTQYFFDRSNEFFIERNDDRRYGLRDQNKSPPVYRMGYNCYATKHVQHISP